MSTKLKTTRQEKTLTQEQLAKECGVAKVTYQRYEAGERVPDAHTAIRIAKALETTVEDLFNEKE